MHVLGKRNAIPHGKGAPQQYTVIKEGLRPVRETMGGFFLWVAQNHPGVPRRQQLDRSDLETKKQTNGRSAHSSLFRGREKVDGLPTRGSAGARILS